MQKEENCWLVIQTFFKKELAVSNFLKEKGIPHFIPMHFREKEVPGARPQRVLVPVVHNYVFIEKQLPTHEIQAVLAECGIALRLLSHKDTKVPYEIPDRDMLEFRMLCDPQFNQQIAIDTEAADLSVGKEVEVVHGHFAGIRGRLIRKKGQYWFVKTVASISVMLRITRWFCKPIES